jgi:hypothetical protein
MIIDLIPLLTVLLDVLGDEYLTFKMFDYIVDRLGWRYMYLLNHAKINEFIESILKSI